MWFFTEIESMYNYPIVEQMKICEEEKFQVKRGIGSDGKYLGLGVSDIDGEILIKKSNMFEKGGLIMKYLYTIIFVLLYSAFLWLAFWARYNAEIYTIYADLSQLYWILCCFAALSAIVCAMLGFIAISQK